MNRLALVVALGWLVACGTPAAQPDAGTGGGGATGGGGGAMGGGGGATGGGGGATGGGGGATPSTFSMSFGATTLPPGAENTLCVTKRLTNPTQLHFDRISTQFTGAWNELLVYAVPDTTESPTPTACQPLRSAAIDATIKPLIFSRSNELVQLPAGVAVTLSAQQMLRFELHLANQGANAELHDATLTFTEATGVFQTEASMLLSMLIDVSIPANQMAAVSGTVLLPADLSGGQLLSFTGFTRSLGVSFTASMNSSVVYSPIYDWAHPVTAMPTVPPTVSVGDGILMGCGWNGGPMNVQFGESSTNEICVLRSYVQPASTRHVCIRTANFGGIDLCCPGNALCSQLF